MNGYDSPFRISKLVTLLSASLGDFWKNLGVRLGGSVRGLRAPGPSQGVGRSAAIFDDVVSLSRCSIDAGLPSSMWWLVLEPLRIPETINQLSFGRSLFYCWRSGRISASFSLFRSQREDDGPINNLKHISDSSAIAQWGLFIWYERASAASSLWF